RAAELVQQHPGGFVPAQRQLPLQQERGQAALVGNSQIRRPEPRRQRRFRIVENRAGGQRDLVAAGRTLPPPLLRQAIGARVSASRACVPVGPPAADQIVLTRFLGGKLTLELAHILRKR